MDGYVITIDNKVLDTVYTSLKAACAFAGVSYASANKGKRIWIKLGKVITITDVEILKIKNRGRK